MTDHRQSTDGAAAVSDVFHWRLIDTDTPRGVKLLLINRRAGVAAFGSLGSSSFYWTHWAPLPTFKEEI